MGSSVEEAASTNPHSNDTHRAWHSKVQTAKMGGEGEGGGGEGGGGEGGGGSKGGGRGMFGINGEGGEEGGAGASEQA